jgi:hypothetical protein
MSELFDRYVEGWVKGDVEMLVSACADDYVYDDPIDGRYTRADIGEYLGSLPAGSLKITEVVSKESDGPGTAWLWFNLKAAPASDVVSQEGAAFNRVGPDGVHLTRVTHYAHPQFALAASKPGTSA